jgi:hypothetical protein
MKKDWWTVPRFATLGFAVALVLGSYVEFTNYNRMNPILILISLISCPAALLTLLAMDVDPHTSTAAIFWLFVGLLNASIYALVGSILRKFVWRVPNLGHE